MSYRDGLPPDFGRRLKKLREKAGITQAQLADATGVTLSRVYQWENGATPRADAFVRLPEALGLPWSRFLTEMGIPAEGLPEGPLLGRVLELVEVQARRLERLEAQLDELQSR